MVVFWKEHRYLLELNRKDKIMIEKLGAQIYLDNGNVISRPPNMEETIKKINEIIDFIN